MKIEKGMYVKTSEIEGTRQWVQVIDAFVASGFAEAEGYTEYSGENYTDDWVNWEFLGITRQGNVCHTGHTESFSQLISVKDLLSPTEPETPTIPTPDTDRQPIREQFWRGLYLKLSGRYDLPYCAEMCDKALAELDDRFGEDTCEGIGETIPDGWIEFDGRNGPTSAVATVDFEGSNGVRYANYLVEDVLWNAGCVVKYRINTLK